MTPPHADRERALLIFAVVSVGVVVVALIAIAGANPALASWLVREDGVVESAQVAVCAIAALGTAMLAVEGGRRGADPSLDIVLTAMTSVLIIGEVDLDKRLFAVKVIATRFFVNPAYSRSVRALAVAVIVGIPVVLGIYVLVRRRALWTACIEELRHPTGRMLLGSVLLFAVTEVFERALGHVPGLPRYFVEEVLELVATLCLLAGVAGRWLRVRETARALALAAPPGLRAHADGPMTERGNVRPDPGR